MNKAPVVSIVMPTYNVEEYIASAIESVLVQSFSDWELLIVDDGSTDNSNAVAQKYSMQDKRIKVLRKENGGLSDARNFGLERACGKYVHFFDSDDCVQPNFYEKMVAAIELRNDDFVICGFFKDFEQPNQTTKTIEFHCETIGTPLPKNKSLNSDLYFYAWNKLFKILFLRNNNLLFEKGLSIIEDIEFISRVLKYKPSFSCVDYLGYRYQVRNRPTLGNQFSDELIPCHFRSISIQCELFAELYSDNNILKCDQGEVTFSTVKWLFHCIFNYSKLRSVEQYRRVSLITRDYNVQKYIGFYNAPTRTDCFMKFLIKYKINILIVIIYSVRNILTN